MKRALTRFLDRFLGATGLQYWPVRVRAGVAKGARWTLYPWTAYWRGTHEPALQQAFIDLGEITGWHCWDLGAHYGIYTVGLARRVGPQGSVAAFEPNPLSYARLERHCRVNGLTWVKTFRAAVSDAGGSADLLTYGDLRSTVTHLAYEGETLGVETRPVPVQTFVLDDLVERGELRAPDFVKVDVEGHGHKALAGAAKTLAKARPVLIVAFHSPNEVQGVLEVLEPLGYGHAIIASETKRGEGLIGQDVLFRPKPRP